MQKWISVASALVVALALGSAAWAADKLKVGFIYVGPIGDFGYSYQHDQGRLAVEKALGDKVETTYLENVPETGAEHSIEQMVRSGAKLIFTTSFGFMDATLKVAKKFPGVHFEHATGFKRAANVSTYSIRWYEGRYVMGKIAGKMTKTNTIGYIVSFPIPEVVSGINAFMLGAQSVNPDVKVKIVWVNSWFDPGKEADAAKALISQGADVLVQHTDSAAPMQEAEKAGKFAFGQASDMIKFGPHAQLTSLTDNWGPYYVKEAKAQLAGTWKSTDTWGGFDADMLVLAPFTNMPDDVKKLASDTVEAIKTDKFHPFQGPIMKQDGTVAVKAGAELADKDILSMNWYIKGIDDKLPQ